MKSFLQVLLFLVGLGVMTLVFGTYSSFIYLRTHSFWSSFLLHAFCNFLGPPSFSSKKGIFLIKKERKLIALFVCLLRNLVQYLLLGSFYFHCKLCSFYQRMSLLVNSLCFNPYCSKIIKLSLSILKTSNIYELT